VRGRERERRHPRRDERRDAEHADGHRHRLRLAVEVGHQPHARGPVLLAARRLGDQIHRPPPHDGEAEHARLGPPPGHRREHEERDADHPGRAERVVAHAGRRGREEREQRRGA
jgi:hypothetical protein